MVETASIYSNSLFEIQVRRRDYWPYSACDPFQGGSPFPAEISDEQILRWHDEADKQFRENLSGRTIERLGDSIEPTENSQ